MEDNKLSMGIPPVLGSPYTVFPRTFRFLFIPKKNPDLQYLVTKVSIDFYQESMDAYIMEAAPDLSSQDWILKMGEDRDYTDDYTLVARTFPGRFRLFVFTLPINHGTISSSTWRPNGISGRG